MKEKPLKKQLTAQFHHKNILVLCVAVFSSLLGGSLNMIVSWIMKHLIDAASGAPGALPIGFLAKASGGFLLICIAVFMLDYFSVPFYIGRAMRQYKDFAFQKLMEKSIATFRDENTAAYLSALTNDATSIEANYLVQQLSLITKAVAFFSALGMMLWYSPLMTAIAAGITILPLIASLLTGGKVEAAEKKVSARNKDFTAALQDCLGGFSVVKSFKAEKEIFKLFAANNRALEGEKFGRRRIKTIVGMVGAVAGICAQLGVFLIGAWLALSGRGMTAGLVIMFVNLMNLVIQPIAELPGLLADRRAARGLIAKLAEALEKNPTSVGDAAITRLKKGVRVKDVSFCYEEGKDVLRDVSADFEAGKAYAVVGGSGSGKSTLLHLLMAGSANYRGEIFFDDTELRRISAESLYGLVSDIQQNVFVFNASIRDNITMFRDFPRKEIDTAIRRANMKDFLAERGENYLCGENGKGLSGGEKQRISIARSLLKKAELLLADEVTASLDAQTAYQVIGDILDLQGITRIVVTHTLEESLLRRYDGIIVLKDGRVEERGSFEMLMEKKGYFHALFTVAQ